MHAHRLPLLFAATCFVVPCFAQSGPCVDDGDCATNEECLLDDVEEGEAVEVEPGGWCYPRAVTCESDADCPEPTRCDDDGECEYVLEACESDAMCDPRYACTDIRGETSCASAGEAGAPPRSTDGAGAAEDPGAEDLGDGAEEASGAGSDSSEEAAPDSGSSASEASDPKLAPDPVPDGDPAGDDSVAAPGTQPPEAEECAPSEPMLVCFPQVEVCEEDADCEGDWTCEALHDDGPGAWSGVEKACLPPGIVGVLDGSIEVEGSGVSEDDVSGDGSGEAPGDEDVIDDDGDVTEPSNDALGLGTQGGSEGSSGCAVGHHPSRGFPWWVLGVGLVLRRRHGRLAPFTRS